MRQRSTRVHEDGPVLGGGGEWGMLEVDESRGVRTMLSSHAHTAALTPLQLTTLITGMLRLRR